MKIALISEYYPPYTPGGAEWSIFYLAQGLKNKGIDVLVITPFYGQTPALPNPEDFDDQGIKVIRYNYPFGRFISGILPPIFHNNLIFWIYSAWVFLFICWREKITILHIQTKYSIPGAFLVKIILRIPIVVTFREKTILCPYNYCLSGNKLKACNFYQFITQDFRWYYQNYSRKNGFWYLISLLTGVYGWITCRILRSLAQHADQIITISQHDKKVFDNNGFKKIKVIYNSINFPGIEKQNTSMDNLILYAGRITYGKGVLLLLEAFEKIVKEFPKIRLELAGAGQPFKLPSKLKNKVKYLGVINHQELLKKYQQASLVVVPTITVEAFGRVALESISRGTPAIVTNIGGLPEVVEDGQWGYVVQPSLEGLIDGIIKGLKHNQTLRDNIKKDYRKVSQKFGKDIIDEYINLYKTL